MDSGPTSWFSHNRSAFRNLILGSSTPVRRGGSFKLQNRTQTSWSFAQTCKHSWATYWIIFFLACQLLQTWPMLSFLEYAVCKTQLTSWKIDSCSSRIIIFWFCWSEKLQLCVPKTKLYRFTRYKSNNTFPVHLSYTKAKDFCIATTQKNNFCYSQLNEFVPEYFA